MKNQLTLLRIVSFLFLPAFSFAQTPNLRSAADFVFFTVTGALSSTGASSVTHKIGTHAGAITGFNLSPGQSENANGITAQASADLQVVSDLLNFSVQTFPTHGAILGNDEILSPGTYFIAEASSIEGRLVLDAGGNPGAIFIIKIQGAFSPGPSSQIILTGGALACNVYWAVQGGAIAMAASSQMKGNFIANPGAVSMAASSTLEGRLLSTTGAIAVDGATVAMPVCAIVLPLTLVNFAVRQQGSAIELLWTTTNEHSLAGYEVQRSHGGITFDSIGFMIPSGGTNLIHYQWTDQKALSSLNFYRLKMINSDGSFAYSSVRSINQKTLHGFSVFPNPVSAQQVQLKIASVPQGNYQLLIYNELGIRMKELDIKIDEAVKLFTVPCHLRPGFYFLVINGAGGSRQAMNMLVQ
jgi:hypothetical protein